MRAQRDEAAGVVGCMQMEDARKCNAIAMAYRIPDADELVNIDDGGRLEGEGGSRHCDRDAGRRCDGQHWLGGGLVLGRARHG